MQWLTLTLSILSILSTIFNIFFVIKRFKSTEKQFDRKIKDSLDSKSGWRKELFKIAGKSEIKHDNVFQFRSALRFKEKDNPNTNFDKMNNIMIKYCKNLTCEDDINKLKESKNEIYTNLELPQQETIRLFCRYMLADHWEKNQNENSQVPKYKETEMLRYTLIQFIRLNSINDNQNDHDHTKNLNDLCLSRLFKKAKSLI
ncbi:hypothetical protein [Staphylococcus arlettae]|uniref:hypothetical protein n=1 Tax=Staphylococcus arlettae TaxID=29378 RepID=UPI000D1B4502|nr:hypothetical protein [Staphylococcus arlettae]PTH65144.1 hypothetical protein BU595_07375 [Staphylococcus arlettae]